MQHSDEEYRAYLGKNAEYYLRAWRDKGKRVHLPALLIGGLWLGFRRLYLAAGLLAFVIAIDLSAGEWLLANGTISEKAMDVWTWASGLLYAGLIAALSHRLVLHRADKVIKKARDRYLDPAERLRWIASKGQTSWLHALIAFVYMLLLAFTISMIALVLLGVN